MVDRRRAGTEALRTPPANRQQPLSALFRAPQSVFSLRAFA